MPLSRCPRVVVADDHPQVLQRVIALLDGHFEVAAAVASGDAALRAVRQLSPDLVMLDIAMPGLSGFEVATQLHEDGHPAKVALMSAAMTDDFVAAGLQVGVRGFVAKARMQHDLVDALDHVHQRRAVVPTTSSFVRAATTADGCHAMQFCASREERLTAVASYFVAAWRAGHVLLAVAPLEDLAALDERLTAAGLDLPAALADGRYAVVDARAAIDAVLWDGHIDAERFTALFGPLIDHLSGSSRRHVSVSGAVVPVLCAEGRFENAVEFEQISNELLRTRPLSILCPCAPTEQALHSADAARLSAEHPTIVSPV